jgi:hypothetical protein
VLVAVLVTVTPAPPGRVVSLVTVMTDPGKDFVLSIVTVAVVKGGHGDCTVEMTVAIEQLEPEVVLEVLDAHSLQPDP